MIRTHEGHLSQPVRCTTRRSVKRKRSDNIKCINTERTSSELKHTIPLEKQTSTESEYEDIYEISRKPKKVKHYENE